MIFLCKIRVNEKEEVDEKSDKEEHRREGAQTKK